MSTSQNHWPALATDSPKLHSWRIPGSDTKLRLRNGSAGFLLCHLALWFDQVVEDVDGIRLDDWGYAFRPVRGYTTTLSNHASGTAMDLNATKHPLGQVGTFNVRDRTLITRRVNRFFGGAIRWGGTYTGRKDEMHFEINVPLDIAERKARALLESPRGKRILAANPGQRAVILS